MLPIEKTQQFTAAKISGGWVVLPLTSSGHVLCWVGSQGHHVLLSQDTCRRRGTGHLGSGEHSGHQSGSPLRGLSGKCIHFVCLCVYKASEKPNIHQRQPRDSLICGGLGVEVEVFSTGHIADAMRSRGPGTCNPGKQGGSPVGGGEISEI